MSTSVHVESAAPVGSRTRIAYDFAIQFGGALYLRPVDVSVRRARPGTTDMRAVVSMSDTAPGC
jgi:hypothetical protein